MKLVRPSLAFAALAALVALVGTSRADDKKAEGPGPVPASVAVAVRTIHKEQPTRTQVLQYGVASELTRWGFAVESRVPTAWDEYLEKAKIKVVKPAEGDEKKKDARATTAFVVEGTLDLADNPNLFYGNKLDVIQYVAKVDVTVRDASGKELRAIRWQNYWGTNKDAGEEKVVAECERRATRFLLLDVYKTKEIAALVPADRKAEFEKFLAEEEAFHKENFDDFTTHQAKSDPAKGDDEKK